MIVWAIAFLIVAIAAAIVGFGGAAIGVVAAAGKFLFVVFMLMFVLSFILGMGRRIRMQRTSLPRATSVNW
ncbi:DUF1328 domain-containing protein [Halopseudomonas laoshanensis]|jgi:uncharacterized membrane protein YtjA (UPF0391 family)|uniref:UPF0391 membrane protein DT594_01265 n=2 Tax=Halopseudomonas TaxID=2901189 RepID=A0A7V7GVM0_9GAMM|nr:DUF1328 domain-containing protein [Halopseudomonas laoshanensis]MBQ0742699.1 DUF1328 domain-containing protein [Pseudomonas sp.]MBQ0776053.1 DUF1328 domain-containing protein [Pseudomonas sp.]PCC99783.1 DUF1328 domain-containing protein [Halopseudomonas pelagia]QFY56356.1 DUF1328 domain-containing protein [Halopseudomonas pelagia]